MMQLKGASKRVWGFAVGLPLLSQACIYQISENTDTASAELQIGDGGDVDPRQPRHGRSDEAPGRVVAANPPMSNSIESTPAVERSRRLAHEDDGDTVAQPGSATECAIAVTAGVGSIPATEVVSFNDYSGLAAFGWAFSTNFFNFTSCNAATPSCVTSGNPATLLATSAFYSPQRQWLGDPVLVAGPPGQLISVQLGSTAATGNSVLDLIVASFSNNNGQTFTSSIEVNDRYSPYSEDQPTAAWDASSNEFCVGWRHRGNGAQLPHPVVRCGRLNVPATNQVTWVTNGNDVPDSTAAGHVFAGMTVQVYTYNSSPYVDIVYTTPNWTPSQNGGTVCPMGTRTQSWYYAEALILPSSGTLSWITSSAIRIAQVANYNPCFLGNRLEDGFRNFGFTWDNLGFSGRLWVAIRGSTGGIDIYESVGGVGTWTKVANVTVPGAVSYWMPNLAARSNGDIELDFYASDSTDTQINRFYSTHLSGYAASQWDAPIAMGSWFSTIAGFGDRQLGDYQGLTAFPAAVPGTFASAYTDNDGGTTRIEVF